MEVYPFETSHARLDWGQRTLEAGHQAPAIQASRQATRHYRAAARGATGATARGWVGGYGGLASVCRRSWTRSV